MIINAKYALKISRFGVIPLLVMFLGILLPIQTFAQEANVNEEFSFTFEDILGSLGMLADVIGEGLVAITLGWAVKPAGIGFLVGMVLLIAFRTVAPVSFEVESLTIVSRIAKRKWHVMIYAVILAGIVGAIMGALGFISAIVEFIGPAIQYGMMTGVGIILAIVAVDLIKENRIIGIVSAGVAFIVFFATIDDPSAIIYALAASVAVSVAVARFVKFEPILPDPEREKISTILPFRNLGALFRKYQTTEESSTGGGTKAKVIRLLTRNDKILLVRAALALIALRLGTGIAYPAIDADIAGIDTVTGSGHSIFDVTSIIAGISGATSAFFGGAPLEPIISGTAASPNPVLSAALMMGIAGVILLLGLIGKAARYIPVQAVTGFLLLLGALIIFPENAPLAMEEDPIVGGVTATVTAATMDPFVGMIAGLITKGLMTAFGLG
jgi:AGZA family xanthine/uracil permease-like MFS transporter